MEAFNGNFFIDMEATEQRIVYILLYLVVIHITESKE